VIKEYDIYINQLPTLGPFKSTRMLALTPHWFDAFYELYQRQTIACDIEDIVSPMMTLHPHEPELELRLNQEGEDYYLSHNLGPFKIVEGQKYLYLLCEREAYRCGKKFAHQMLPILQTMRQSSHFELRMNEAYMGKFLSLVVPQIKNYIRETSLESLYDKFKAYPLISKFYLDSLKRGNIGLKVQFCYGDVVILANDPKSFEQSTTILRDSNKEAKILATLEQDQFKKQADGTYLIDDEEAIYHFLHQGFEELKELGEVYASETFKAIKITEMKSFSVGVHLKNDWLSINFEDLAFEPAEYKKILASYRQHKKYFRLKDGSFLNLKNEYVDSLATFIDDLNLNESSLAEEEILIPKYRALYLEQLIKTNDSLMIEPDDNFQTMVNAFKQVEDADFSVPVSLESTLRTYQKTGYRWIKTLSEYQMGGILADDMGLGKTLQVISVLLSEKEKTNKPSLIVAPSSLVYNWESEIHKFAPELSTLIIHGDPTTREQLIQKSSQVDIVITSYDLIRRDQSHYEAQKFRYCILDEAHYIKNHTTLSAKAVKKIKSEIRFALTGTPIENSLSDLWSIFDFILPGYFGTYAQFKKKYEVPVMKHQNLNLLSRIHQQVAPFILRRLKKDVLKELPEKIETNMYCEMEKTQRDLYHAMIYEMKEEMNQEIEAQGIERSRIKILALLMRLRQICCDPSLYLENYMGGSAKLKLCLELVEECISTGHKVLIFSQFTSMLDILSQQFKEKSIEHLMLTGATKTNERLALTEQFNSDDTPVFLISLKAGGTGLNLTGADVVIHYDPWWNMSAQNQATDRAHRLGQEKTVQVFKLFVKNTIEEKIEQLQQRKRDLTEAIVQEGETFITQLSTEELTALFESDDHF
nr:DEAD/DEAH box helicase [Turicibacter sp.]